MKRFAIEIVRGNDTRLFGTYDTKEQGYEVGKESQTTPKQKVNCN